jgi:hypothetical protein
LPSPVKNGSQREIPSFYDQGSVTSASSAVLAAEDGGEISFLEADTITRF